MSDSAASWPFLRKVARSRPNWVASTAADADRCVEAFPLRGTPEESLAKLADVIRDQSRITVTNQSPDRLQAVATSLIFRFRDDVEFVATPKRIEVLSASRIGRSDLGANARRVAALRAAYEQA